MINRDTIIYREGGRQMTVSGEMLIDGCIVHRSSVISWDDSNGELITSAEQERIVTNIKASLEAQGAKVTID